MAWTELNGKRFHYSTGGKEWQDGQPAVVFVHGAGGDQSVWKFQSRAISHAGWNVMAVDLPGHGRSDDLPELASVEDHAAWLHEMIQATELGPATVVGHSMGSCITATFGATYGDAVAGVVLIGSAMQILVNDQLLHDCLNNQRAAIDFLMGFGLDNRYKACSSPVPGVSVPLGMTAIMMRTAPEIFQRDFQICKVWDGAAYAKKLQAPTLVLSGETDRLTPAKMGRALADTLANSQLEILPNVGHMLPAEAPRQVMLSLRNFLSEQRTAA